MKLYLAPGACSMASHISLIELGIPHSLEFVDLKAQPHILKKDGSLYGTINPKGSVPAIRLDSGDVLTENAVILPYLADLKPDSGLFPKNGTMARQHAMESVCYLSSDLHKSFGPLLNSKLPDEARPILVQGLERRLSYLEQELSKRAYLLGETFSVADAYLWVLLSWLPRVKLDLSQYPHLSKFQTRVGERPSVQKMLETEKSPS